MSETPRPPPPKGLLGLFAGSGLMARAARGSTWTALSFVASQGLRLGSNLILTRLLFPEAFGIMALVTMILVGLMLFSDMGVAPAIMQSKRGDEPDFLNTAWTLQILRGGVLWLVACGLALPVAAFYDQPMLAQLLPVASLALLIAGFEPTRTHTASRHLLLGRVTALDLISTATGIVVMLAAAAITRSVWSLPMGSVAGAAVHLTLMTIFLPGASNRLRWERPAVHELTHFGFWIFLSSACGFLVGQGDRAILGKFLTMQGLGIYNIGAFLASFPLLLGQAVTSRVLIPLYREQNEPSARARLHRLRYWLTGGLLVVLTVLALGAPYIVGLLYDSRYIAAGGIMAAICLVQMVQVISLTYDQAALAAGSSRDFFITSLAKALLQTGGFLLGSQWMGLYGALVFFGIGAVLHYPVIAWVAHRHRAWDPRHDAVFGVVVASVAGLVVWLHADALAMLIPGAGSGIH